MSFKEVIGEGDGLRSSHVLRLWTLWGREAERPKNSKDDGTEEGRQNYPRGEKTAH